jgi:hypothetical protein
MSPTSRTTAATESIVLAVCLLLAPAAWAGSRYKVLHTFGSGQDGSVPSGPLLLDSRGYLYGVTRGGPGQYGYGVAFALTPQAHGMWKELILHTFTGGADGAFPDSGLVLDRAGNLHGTVQGDIRPDVGGVFELSRNATGWVNTMLYSGNVGQGIASDKLGNLYGEMGSGQYKYGAIAELSPGASADGWVYTPLYSLSFTDGYALPAPPIWGGKGNLFGTTTFGGITKPPCYDSRGCGIAFEMTPSKDGTWTYHILHRFGSYTSDGLAPYGGLVMDTSGNFYGTTQGGGIYGYGTAFKLTFAKGHWKKTAVYDFPDLPNGLPDSTLVLDKAGNLYGAAGGGKQGCGPYTCGFILKLTPQSNGTWKYNVIHKFSGPDGNFPVGVVVDSKGKLFGTTANGGTYNSGVAFEITP